ncbi:MAG: hypothetical protein MI923_26075 [Phycisphaerales bacterium]|nr:hypothetical protein [Phycisphaerales bacterium]
MDKVPEDQRTLLEEKRRHRVLKRTVRACLSFVLLLIIVRVIWGLYSAHLLQAEIERCHDAGEPILIEDFAIPGSVPDADNAAIVYGQASVAFKKAETSWFSLDDVRAPSTHPEIVHPYVEKNEEVLLLLRKARGMPIDWGSRYTSPMINAILPSLSGQRQLAKLARTAAMTSFSLGDQSEAIETLFDLLEISVHLNSPQNQVLITHLVIIAIESLAIESLEFMTPTLVSHDKESGQKPSVPVGRDRIQDLIRALLDEESIRSSWKNAVFSERAAILDTTRQVVSGGLGLNIGPATMMEKVFVKAFQPMFELDGARSIRHIGHYSEAGLESSYSAGQSLIPEFEVSFDNTSATYDLAHIMQTQLFFSPSRALVLHFRVLASRRMAATALAIRLYELDHGHRPASLAELVPTYIQAVPSDPFSPENKPLGYLPEASPPILYSVNRDGFDNDGVYIVLQSGKLDRELSDLPFFLNGDRPRQPLQALPEE